MRRHDIARRWERGTNGDYRMRDAAGHIIAEVWMDERGLWQGYILPRDGRADLGIPCDAKRPETALLTVEGELAGIRSTESERQLIAARSASPMRPLDRQAAPVDGLALFDAFRSPELAL